MDTGANKTLVHVDLVTPDDFVYGAVTIQCAHGDMVSYPIAAVKITVAGKEIITHAAVAKSLPVAALLGWDVPELMKLIKPGIKSECTTKALAAVPYSQEDLKDSSISTPDPQTTDNPENPGPDYDNPNLDAEAQSITKGKTSPVAEFDFEDSLFFLSRPQQNDAHLIPDTSCRT